MSTNLEEGTPRMRFLWRLAAARVRDDAGASPMLRQELRDELNAPVLGIVGGAGAILAESSARGDERLMGPVRRIAALGEMLPAQIDDVLDVTRVIAGQHADEWEMMSVRLRAYLRPLVLPIASVVELLAEDPATLGHDRLVNDAYAVGSAAQYLLALIDDVVGVLEVFGGHAQPEEVSSEAREVIERFRPAQPGARKAPEMQGAVLVVDDSAANRDVLDRLLARMGFTVTLAADGRQAMAVMPAGRFDLVLLDIIMPEVDGFQVLHRIKSDEALRGVPVIMISALDESESVQRCLEMGAEDYLTKPFDPVFLRQRIASVLERKRLRAYVGRRDAARFAGGAAGGVGGLAIDPVKLR
jgi:CheY-like chemotaxis protein